VSIHRDPLHIEGLGDVRLACRPELHELNHGESFRRDVVGVERKDGLASDDHDHTAIDLAEETVAVDRGAVLVLGLVDEHDLA